MAQNIENNFQKPKKIIEKCWQIFDVDVEKNHVSRKKRLA